MKRILLIVLSVVIALGITATPFMAQDQLAEFTLWAGQDINTGSVYITIDGDTLSIDYGTIDGWEMTETHLYLDTSPPIKSAPGRFPYKHEDLGGVTEDRYIVLLSELGIGPGDTIFVAAQAALQKLVVDENGAPILDEDDNPIYDEESGWAEGDPIRPGKNWAMFFSFDIPADD